MHLIGHRVGGLDHDVGHDPAAALDRSEEVGRHRDRIGVFAEFDEQAWEELVDALLASS